MTDLRTLYPMIDPDETGTFDTGGGHILYDKQSGPAQ
jgi:hypothetical protein